MKKRSIAVALLAAMVMGTISGCSSLSEPADTSNKTTQELAQKKEEITA